MKEYAWTAAELMRLSDRLPAEARTTLAQYDTGQGVWLEGCSYCSVKLVAAIIFDAAFLWWLCNVGGLRFLPPKDERGVYIDDSVMPPRVTAIGPTPLHALVSAIEAVKGGRDA